MPRSRSWSLESITRSTNAWWAAKTPVARSSASTKRGLAVVDVRDERDVAERHQELSSGDGSRAAVRQEPCYTSSSSSSSKGTLYFSAKAAYSSSSSVS